MRMTMEIKILFVDRPLSLYDVRHKVGTNTEGVEKVLCIYIDAYGDSAKRIPLSENNVLL